MNGLIGSVGCRFATASDSDRLQRFIAEAYGPEASWKGLARWSWQFVSNPEASADGSLYTVIALDGDQIAGQIAVEPARLWIGDESRPSGWIVDVMVLPRYRGCGLGHQMQEKLVSGVPSAITLTMAPATRRMNEKAGAVTLGPVRTFCLLRSVKALDVRRFAVRRLCPRGGVRGIIGRVLLNGPLSFLASLPFAAAAAAQAVRGALARRKPGAMSMERVEAFEEEFDDLAMSNRVSGTLSVGRGSAWMKWRFSRAPDLCYEVIAAREAGALIGYAAIRRMHGVELRGGVIADLMTRPGRDDAARALLTEAIRRLEGVSFVVAGASMAVDIRRLRSFGFVSVRTHHPTIATADSELRDQLMRCKQVVRMTMADHDWDQIRPVLDFSSVASSATTP